MCSPLTSDPTVAPGSHASLRLRLEIDSVDVVCFGHPRRIRTLASIASDSSQPSQAIGAHLPTHGALPTAGVDLTVLKLRRGQG